MLKNIVIVLGFIALVLFITYGVGQNKHTNGKSKWLPCHNEVVVFEKVYKPKLLEEARTALEQQNYVIDSQIQKAHYMKSELFEYVKIKNVDQYLKETISDYQSQVKKETKQIKLKYMIYENDINDPGKKTQKSKKYAGYLKFEVIYKSKKVYAIQIDFMDKQGKDIPERITCAMKSLMTIAL